AISTGTNNVFPSALDGTGAGVAAGLLASGAVDADEVASPSKRVTLRIVDPRADAPIDEGALVDAALIDTPFAGARAVTDPAAIRWIVAAIADPAATGIAGVAGRLHEVARSAPGGVLIRLGPGGRRVRVPLSPGRFETLDVSAVEPLEPSSTVELPGGGVLAYDGERTTPVSAEAVVTASVDSNGPLVIDVDKALSLATACRSFDLPGGGGGY
ncbi:MAG: hypothetical protein ACR2O6_14715, partial [Ilumatobacteraceae bacterium]